MGHSPPSYVFVGAHQSGQHGQTWLPCPQEGYSPSGKCKQHETLHIAWMLADPESCLQDHIPSPLDLNNNKYDFWIVCVMGSNDGEPRGDDLSTLMTTVNNE